MKSHKKQNAYQKHNYYCKLPQAKCKLLIKKNITHAIILKGCCQP